MNKKTKKLKVTLTPQALSDCLQDMILRAEHKTYTTDAYASLLESTRTLRDILKELK